MDNVSLRHRQIASFVQEHVTVGRVRPGNDYTLEAVYPTPASGASLPTAEQLAERFLADLEGQPLQIGGFFGTPSAEFLTEAVKSVIPDSLEPEVSLIVTALQVAAARQQGESRERVAKGALLGAGISIVVTAIIKGSR